MIAPPTRVGLAARPVAPSARTATEAGDADSGPTGAPSNGAPALDEAAIDARIAALVARASTPEDEALERQREEFDLVTRIQAEADRETNALRDLAMVQQKFEDELLKKWIELI